MHSRTDFVRGVSESIIIGTPVPLGTGLFKVCMPPPAAAGGPPASSSGTAGRHRALPLLGGGRPMGDSDALQEALAALSSVTAMGGEILRAS